MAKSSVIAVRIDPDTKKQLDDLYSKFGLTLSDAINMFIHQSINVGGLPFELKSPARIKEDEVKAKALEIDGIKKAVGSVAKEFGVRELYLFGSRARGDNGPDSDYDFCIDMGGSCGIMKLVGLRQALEKVLKANVDFVYRDSMPARYEDAVRDDGILIYKSGE